MLENTLCSLRPTEQSNSKKSSNSERAGQVQLMAIRMNF